MYCCYIFTSSIQYTSIKLVQAVEDGSLKSLWKNTKEPHYFQNHHWDLAIVLACRQCYISSKREKKKATLGPGEGLTECLRQCNAAALNHPGEALHSCPELAFSDVAFSLWGDGELSSETEISGQIWKAKQILPFELSPRETSVWKKSHHIAFPPIHTLLKFGNNT